MQRGSGAALDPAARQRTIEHEGCGDTAGTQRDRDRARTFVMWQPGEKLV